MSHPPTDPRLVTVLTRLRSLRVALDRLDDAIDLLDRDIRFDFATESAEIRARLDDLDTRVERLAAGL